MLFSVLQISGFPTIKVFNQGNKGDPEEYGGGRSEEDFIEYAKGKVAA